MILDTAYSGKLTIQVSFRNDDMDTLTGRESGYCPANCLKDLA